MRTYTLLFFLLTVKCLTYCQEDSVIRNLELLMEKQEALLKEIKELRLETKESCVKRSDFQEFQDSLNPGLRSISVSSEIPDYPEIIDGQWRYNVFLPDVSVPELDIDVDSDVQFLLWTRDNQEDNSYYTLKINDDDNVRESPFDGTKPTVFVAHGWTDKGTTNWILKAKTEYLKFQDCNFISIDWERIAASSFYPRVAKAVPKVGQFAAQFLDRLHEKHDLNISGVYLVGFSLGAQVMGNMGFNVKTRPLPRITGLDPAGPGFYVALNSHKLSSDDATFVDVIHTNAGLMGFATTVGHVDFFPNGGSLQPGCSLVDSSCNHNRAPAFWTESINGETPFRAVPCTDLIKYYLGKCTSCGEGCLDMGVHVAQNLQGKFYLRTEDKSPFAKG